MKIVPIYGGSIFRTKYWNNKVLFIKTALLKNKIITIFVKLVHKSFVSWNKKSSLECTFKHCYCYHTYLGITVSSDLKWHEHKSLISALRQRTLNFVRRNTYCSQRAKNLAYLSLVRPHLEYAAAAWDPYTAKDIQQLERVQRRAARFVKKISPYNYFCHLVRTS